MSEPILFGTQKDYAWDAYQSGFGKGGVLLPDRADFEDWWNMFGLGVQWQDLREMFHAAWGKGVQNRNVQGTAGYDAWWQEILDKQPVFGEATP